LVFCFLRWAISSWTVVRIDCWDSFDAATTKRIENFRIYRQKSWSMIWWFKHWKH
jgi:hypothetical protein